jgi:small subunit ribosomal protein S19
MGRQAWKLYYTHPEIYAQHKEATVTQTEFKNAVLFNRSTYISKSMLGMTFEIYNGLRFTTLTVTPDKIGYKVGEFAATRKKPVEKKKKKKSK